MSHTPGPWKLGEDEPFVYALNEDGVNQFWASVQPGWLRKSGIGSERTSHEEVMANARLIAAAPELLSALGKAAHWMEECGELTAGDETIAVVRAAIAKAKGAA